MIHLINFLVKIIATLVFGLVLIPIYSIALIMWDEEIFLKDEEIFNLIWKKQKK
jgi:hypothetical protein